MGFAAVARIILMAQRLILRAGKNDTFDSNPPKPFKDKPPADDRGLLPIFRAALVQTGTLRAVRP